MVRYPHTLSQIVCLDIFTYLKPEKSYCLLKDSIPLILSINIKEGLKVSRADFKTSKAKS